MFTPLLRRLAFTAFSLAWVGRPPVEQPETVMITLHAKAGADSALRSVIDGHWATLERLHLAAPAPHTTLRGSESGGVFFVEIFTWRDAAVPDNAPAEVRAWWTQMSELTEPRSGHPGIDILELADVTRAAKAGD